MPYGAEVVRLESVHLSDGMEIAAYPEVMQALNLKAGQTVDDETAKMIVSQNERMIRFK